MLKTPASFTSLLSPQPHAAPANFIFSGDTLLVHEATLALPSLNTLAQLGLPVAQFYPVGLLGNRYCQTSWINPITAQNKQTSEADTSVAGTLGLHGRPDLTGTGLAFRKLRSLFGRGVFERDSERGHEEPLDSPKPRALDEESSVSFSAFQQRREVDINGLHRKQPWLDFLCEIHVPFLPCRRRLSLSLAGFSPWRMIHFSLDLPVHNKK